MQIRKQIEIVLCMLLLTASLIGCGKEKTTGTVYQIYTVNKEDTKVNSREFVALEEDGAPSVEDMLYELQTANSESTDRAAIPDDVSVEWEMDENHTVTLDFSKEYRALSPNAEVLTRAAVVRTLCQLDDVDFVSFRVEGEELVNQSGVGIGIMNADQFVENDGSEINSYEKVSITLYYASEDGTSLKTCKVDKVYNSNISMEKLVVEQLIEGPAREEDGMATVDPATKVLSVTVKDGTCYVNFDSAFLNQMGNCSAQATVYSVVNSLTELTNVNKVQISVDGETDISYRETVSLAQALERNYEIME